jgi:hypothetical protein
MSSTRGFATVVVPAVVAFAVSASLLPSARAQLIQQGEKLIGTDFGYVANQGQSVALSGDGNTAIVGGPIDNRSVGAAWVYTRSGGVWRQQGGKLVGTGAVGSDQGTSVVLSADGNTVMVVGDGDHNYGVGAAWVYARSGGVWRQQGGQLVPTSALFAFERSSVAPICGREYGHRGHAQGWTSVGVHALGRGVEPARS